MAHNYRDLKRGLGELAKRAEKEKVYASDPKMADLNKAAVKVFTNPAPVFANPDNEGLPTNVTWRSLLRVNIMLRRNGIDWPNFDWDALMEWLYENWDKVLRTLVSLLTLLII